jgi:hypothetical protein
VEHSFNFTFWYFSGDSIYEGEPVNRSQMDVKHKIHDIQTWKKTSTVLWAIECTAKLPIPTSTLTLAPTNTHPASKLYFHTGA